MGYYTMFEFQTDKEELINKLREKYDCANYALDDYGEPNNSTKWYDHESDIKEFSKDYPNEVFKLIGNGESNDDMWIKYFKNGKVQICKAKITFDKYDENKLE